jgi:hypothetical protein
MRKYFIGMKRDATGDVACTLYSTQAEIGTDIRGVGGGGGMWQLLVVGS